MECARICNPQYLALTLCSGLRPKLYHQAEDRKSLKKMQLNDKADGGFVCAGSSVVSDVVKPPAASSILEALDNARMTWRHYAFWLIASGGALLDGFSVVALGVALPLPMRDFTISPLIVGLIGSALVLGAVAGAALGGVAADSSAVNALGANMHRRRGHGVCCSGHRVDRGISFDTCSCRGGLYILASAFWWLGHRRTAARKL